MEINQDLLPEVSEGDILRVVKIADGKIVLQNTGEQSAMPSAMQEGDRIVDKSPLTGPLPALRDFLMQRQSRADSGEQI